MDRNKYLQKEKEDPISPRGVPIYGPTSWLKFATESFIAAKRGAEIVVYA